MITIKPTVPGKVYAAHLVPSVMTQDEVSWSRVDRNEDFNFELRKECGAWEPYLIECAYDEEAQDWTDRVIPVSSGPDLTLYLPGLDRVLTFV